MKKNIGKKFIFGFFVFLLAGVLMVAIELGLRLFGVGYDTEPFVREKSPSDFYVDNPKFIYKYYSSTSGLSPQPATNVFLVNKPANSIRGFVIGESTAQGFPLERNHSFSAIIEAALTKTAKYDTVEMINLGNSAMSSYYVKDTALKAIKYQPDFLIVYSGHNEYYGTIGRLAGGNDASIDLYLFLKEFRIFQLFYDLIGGRKGDDSDATLMAAQFAGKSVSSDDPINKDIERDYTRNLGSVIDAYKSRGIPVFVVEPVSNLLSMPPFAAENDSQLKSYISEYFQKINAGDKAGIELFVNSASRDAAYEKNANVLYLDGIKDLATTGRADLAKFQAAKDADIIPFRMRSSFGTALKELVSVKATGNPGVVYVDLKEQILRSLGPKAFGGQLFIDHLHFNFYGNRFLAYILSREIAKQYKYTEEENKLLDSFLNDPDQVRAAIFLAPAQEYLGYSIVGSLLKQPPFSSMRLPFQKVADSYYFAGKDFFDDKTVLEKLTKALQNNDQKSFYDTVNSYFYQKKDAQAQLQLLKMFIQIGPTNPNAYLAVAQFYQTNLGDEARAASYYGTAYRFGARDQEIFNTVKAFFDGKKEAATFERLIARYGKPGD